MNKPVRAIKNKKQIVETRVKPQKNDDSYYKLYKREMKERKRLQHIEGLFIELNASIDKVNKENEEIFNQLRVQVDYWRFSFILSESHGVDFLNYEIGLLEKGLMLTEEDISKLNIPRMDEK